jgi:hypothetical protein
VRNRVIRFTITFKDIFTFSKTGFLIFDCWFDFFLLYLGKWLELV